MKRLLERLRIRRSIAEELNAHLEEKIGDLVESGLPEAEARLRARREFGNAALIAEDSRGAGMDVVRQPRPGPRYACRMLRRGRVLCGGALLP
jgi:putative ABC transport system permease protein